MFPSFGLILWSMLGKYTIDCLGKTQVVFSMIQPWLTGKCPKKTILTRLSVTSDAVGELEITMGDAKAVQVCQA